MYPGRFPESIWDAYMMRATQPSSARRPGSARQAWAERGLAGVAASDDDESGAGYGRIVSEVVHSRRLVGLGSRLVRGVLVGLWLLGHGRCLLGIGVVRRTRLYLPQPDGGPGAARRGFASSTQLGRRALRYSDNDSNPDQPRLSRGVYTVVSARTSPPSGGGADRTGANHRRPRGNSRSRPWPSGEDAGINKVPSLLRRQECGDTGRFAGQLRALLLGLGPRRAAADGSLRGGGPVGDLALGSSIERVP
jgi:hypothetical protein